MFRGLLGTAFSTLCKTLYTGHFLLRCLDDTAKSRQIVMLPLRLKMQLWHATKNKPRITLLRNERYFFGVKQSPVSPIDDRAVKGPVTFTALVGGHSRTVAYQMRHQLAETWKRHSAMQARAEKCTPPTFSGERRHRVFRQVSALRCSVVRQLHALRSTLQHSKPDAGVNTRVKFNAFQPFTCFWSFESIPDNASTNNSNSVNNEFSKITLRAIFFSQNFNQTVQRVE